MKLRLEGRQRPQDSPPECVDYEVYYNFEFLTLSFSLLFTYLPPNRSPPLSLIASDAILIHHKV